MPKPNPLTQGLEQQQPLNVENASPPQRQRKPRTTRAKIAATREGRVLIAGHFAPEVQIALKIIAAQERTTIQALLTEGINRVFTKRRQPEIADINPQYI